MSSAPPPAARFLNRELSWLEFNARVLSEALDARNPLLERLKFLAIFSANLDEFYMVRVAALRRVVALTPDARGEDGRTRAEELEAVRERVGELMRRQRECLREVLLPELAEHGIAIVTTSDLDPREWAAVDSFVEQRALPAIERTPLGAGHPLPSSSRVLCVAVEAQDGSLSCVKVPATLPRWVATGREGRVVPLEQVIGAHLRTIVGDEVRAWFAFRIMRWSDITIGGDGADVAGSVEEQLFGRRFAEVARVEFEDATPDRVRVAVRDSLREEDDELDDERVRGWEADVMSAGSLLQLADLFSLGGTNAPGLRDAPFTPRPVAEFAGESAFDAISRQDVLVHHPFESFASTVERFLEDAAADAAVTRIRVTLYRTSGSTAIVRALTEAARRGKDVAVVVELKARFDEAKNLTWARTLDRAGVRVTHAPPELKTHAKIALVERAEAAGIRRYAHIGTGNYNARTSRVYTDLGLFTARADVTSDVAALFEAITGSCAHADYSALLVSPVTMRPRIIELIDREIRAAESGRPARIVAKMNALVDAGVIERLYDASSAGVRVELLVRGMCTLRPGVEGLSERISVTSVVGRFLEHSRVWRFENSGAPEYFIGSADWMERNLDRRVEVVVNVDDPLLKSRLQWLLDTYQSDNRQAWDLRPDGSYVQRTPGADEERAAQRIFLSCPWGGE